jgi:hypothetical protein
LITYDVILNAHSLFTLRIPNGGKYLRANLQQCYLFKIYFPLFKSV